MDAFHHTPPCHSRESGNPSVARLRGERNYQHSRTLAYWVPAFAGMTQFYMGNKHQC
jgi:hypothetical protein